MFLNVYFPIVVAVNLCYLVLLLRAAFRGRRRMLAEPGNPVLLSLYAAGLQFLAAFGISDFSISIMVYRKFRLIEDEQLPGTLMNACVIPVAVMALGYLQVVAIEETTLLVCVLCSLAGAAVGSLVVSRLNTASIRLLMACALLVAGGTILLRAAGLMPAGGAASGFHGWRLAAAGGVTFVLAALSMGGFAVIALLLSFFYAMGLDPAAAFPLAMGTCTLACGVGGIRYVRRGRFGLKLALTSTLFGSLGAFAAVHFVGELDVGALQWLILAVVLYSAVSLLKEYREGRRRSAAALAEQKT